MGRLLERLQSRVDKWLAAPTRRFVDLREVRWPGSARAAVSLSYDDGLPSHSAEVVPLLEAHQLRGTFYIHVTAQHFLEQLDPWRQVASNGHELGNHTLFHPCRDNPHIDAGWNLSDYTPLRWREEVRIANWILQQIDGHGERTFGNTCFDNVLGRGERAITIESLAPEFFVAARGEQCGEVSNSACVNLFNIGTMSGDGRSFADLERLLNENLAAGTWLVLTFHGLNPQEHSMHIAEADHLRLLEWLAARRDMVFTAPVRDVAKHLAPFATAQLPRS